MENARVITLIKALSRGEIRRFSQFVESPFFNQNSKLPRLLGAIQRAAPNYGSELLAKEVIFAAVFGKESPFNEQKLRDQMSQLMRLLEQFLAQLEYQKEDALQARQLLQALDRRNLADHFTRQYQKEYKKQEKAAHRDYRFFLDSYLLEQIRDAFSGKRLTRKLEGDLSALGESLDAFYLGAKLRSTCEMLNRSRILNQPFRSELMEEIKLYLSRPDHRYQDVPSVNIYYQIYRTLVEEESHEAFRKLVELLQEHANLFPKSEAYAMYAYAQNFCIRQINQGESTYLEELFLIYRRLLKEDLLIRTGVLVHEHYKNINTLALKLQEYEWAKEFLETYQHKLPAEYKENAFTYNLAVWYYEQKQDKEAMKLLNQVEFTDVYYHLSAKFILLKIYYEHQDQDGFTYLIRAFSALLNRNQQISTYQLQAYRNLIRMIRKVARLRLQQNQLEPAEFTDRLLRLQEEARECNGLANANWLFQKMEELKPPAQQA